MTLIIFLVILGLLIIVHEYGHFLAARKSGVRVEKFSVGFGRQILTKRKGETEYSLSLIPLGGYVKLAGDSLQDYLGRQDEFFSKAPGKRFWIIFCGPLLNYLLGFLLFWVVFFSGYPALTAKVGELLEGFGAKDAGIMVGDRIIAVDARAVRSFEELQAAILAKKSDSVALEIERGTERLNLKANLKSKEFVDPLGKKRRVRLLGISPAEEFISVRYGFFESGALALKRVWFLTRFTYEGLWQMITRQVSIRDSVSGPLGIFFITAQAAQAGISALAHLVAILSISLAIFNLLPLPVLDGGHIALLFLEKLRKKPLAIKAERLINNIGLTLIITLAVFVTYNDIVKFLGDKILKLVK